MSDRNTVNATQSTAFPIINKLSTVTEYLRINVSLTQLALACVSFNARPSLYPSASHSLQTCVSPPSQSALRSVSFVSNVRSNMRAYLRRLRVWTACLKDEVPSLLLHWAHLFRPLRALLQRATRMADTRDVRPKYRESWEQLFIYFFSCCMEWPLDGAVRKDTIYHTFRLFEVFMV